MKRKLLNLGLILAVAISVFSTNAKTAWGETPASAIRPTPPAPQFSDAERQSELAKRRQAVAAALNKQNPNSALILFSAQPRIYTGDVDYVFRQENNLYYLTALKKAGATLVLLPGSAQTPEILFLPKRNAFNETWTGKMLTPIEAERVSGVKTVLDADQFEAFAAALKNKQDYQAPDGKVISLKGLSNLSLLLPGGLNDEDGKREFARELAFAKDWAIVKEDAANGRYVYEPSGGYKISNAEPVFAELRLVKSPYEIKLMQHAVDITIEAQERAWAAAKNAKMEYEVQAEVEYIFRKRNADFWGYPSIVGCGENATTLHYEESQGAVKPNDLLLMDVGAEYDHYTADVTRTFPINGKFSKEQAEIYQIVYDAQEAVGKITKPGASFKDANEAAREVIKDRLFKLGLITDKNSEQYRVWFMHGTSHWLGMNVHDVGAQNTKFKPGMIFTNEPGVYLRPDALDNLPDGAEWQKFKTAVRPAFEKYKNIGVRIEDDLLVTETGAEWLTKNLPRKMDEIESLMARARQEPLFNTTAMTSAPRQNDFFKFGAY